MSQNCNGIPVGETIVRFSACSGNDIWNILRVTSDINLPVIWTFMRSNSQFGRHT